MICPRCFCENPDDAVFCARCGFRTASAPFRSKFKELLASPLFLWICIAFVLNLVFGLISAFEAPALLSSPLDEFGYTVNRVEGFVFIFSTAISYFFLISPQIVIAIGLFMMYAFGKRSACHDRVKGLSVVKTGVVINEVISYIGYALAILIIVFLAIFSGLIDSFALEYGADYPPNVDLSVIMLIILIPVLTVIVILAILTIIYYVKLRRVMREAKRSFETGVASFKGTKYVFVIHFILAAFCLIGAIPVILTSGISAFLSSLATGAFHLLLGIFLTTKFENVR